MKIHKRIPAVLIALFLLGCTDAYRTAAKLGQDVAVSIHQAGSTVDTFRLQGAISPGEEREILGYFQSLNTVNGQYLVCIEAAEKQTLAGGFTKCARTFADSLGHPEMLAALHVSNPAKQQEIIAIANGIVTLATVTIGALGGK